MSKIKLAALKRKVSAETVIGAFQYIQVFTSRKRQKEWSCHGHPSDFFLRALTAFTITSRRQIQGISLAKARFGWTVTLVQGKLFFVNRS